MNYILFLMTLVAMLTAFAVSIFQWKTLNKADRFISLLIGATFISEVISDYFAKAFRNNMPVYHFFDPVQYFLLCLYFNETIVKFKKRNIGVWMGAAGALFAIYTSAYLQDIHSFPSVFLIFESFVIIALCLFSYFQIFLREDAEIRAQAYFWFTTILLIFWSFTFVVWGMVTVFLKEAHEFMNMVYPMLAIINFITYAGIALVFLNYKKLIPSGE